MEELLNVDQVCEELGVTPATLATWYKFRQENPSSVLGCMLPDMVRRGPRNARYWKREDLKALKEFKVRIPRGCKGIMGRITQKYVKPKKQED